MGLYCARQGAQSARPPWMAAHLREPLCHAFACTNEQVSHDGAVLLRVDPPIS